MKRLMGWLSDAFEWLKSNGDDPDGINRPLRVAVVGAALFVAGFGIWATTASLAGAVLASGTVVVDGSVKKVQHANGGTVGEIRVKDGQRVVAGDLLIKLDETLVRANLQVITKMLDELAIRQARLIAERDGKNAMVVPSVLAERSAKPEITALIEGERSLFNSRKSARVGQKS
jgi:HlyD family secretion protein